MGIETRACSRGRLLHTATTTILRCGPSATATCSCAAPTSTRPVEILQREGLQRRFGAPRSSFDRRFVKAIALVADDGLELHLHRVEHGACSACLARRRGRSSSPRSTTSISRGHRMSCLAPQLALADVCVHAVLGDDVPRLVAVRDVVQLLAAGLDVPATIVLVRSLPRALSRTRGLASSRRSSGRRRRVRGGRGRVRVVPSRADRWRMRSYVGGENRYPTQAAATFWVLPRSAIASRKRVGARVPRPQVPPERDTSYLRRLTWSTSLVVRERPR